MAEDPIICSACHKEIPADGSRRVPALCPHCGAMVIIDDAEDKAPEVVPAEEQELEERRIRQIVRSRRAVVRMRGWYMVGLLAAGILAVQQLIWFAAAIVRHQGDARQVARLSLAAVLLGIAVVLRERTKRLTAELRRHSSPEPTTPPDFTSLSDGSQQVRNLEKLDEEP